MSAGVDALPGFQLVSVPVPAPPAHRPRALTAAVAFLGRVEVGARMAEQRGHRAPTGCVPGHQPGPRRRPWWARGRRHRAPGAYRPRPDPSRRTCRRLILRPFLRACPSLRSGRVLRGFAALRRRADQAPTPPHAIQGRSPPTPARKFPGIQPGECRGGRIVLQLFPRASSPRRSCRGDPRRRHQGQDPPRGRAGEATRRGSFVRRLSGPSSVATLRISRKIQPTIRRGSN
jgi:hypothetical protein